MNIRKVKFNGETVEIQYEPSDAENTTLMALKSEDQPEPELGASLQGLAEVLCDLIEVPRNYAESIVVTGLTLRHQEDAGVMGIITAQKSLGAAEAPFNINTPMAAFPEGSQWRGRIAKVEAQAIRYLQGHRAQGAFNFGDSVTMEACGGGYLEGVQVSETAAARN